MSVPLFNNGPIDQLMLINVLNVMYNENTRQIQQLNESNAEIRNVITNILYSRVNNDNNIPSSHRTTHTSNNRNAHTGNNRNTHNANTYSNTTNYNNRNRNTHNNNNRNTTSSASSAASSASSASAYSANNSSVSNANRRIYIDNIPYLIENIQRYTLPTSVIDSYVNLGSNTSRTRTPTSTPMTQLGSFFDPVVIYPTRPQIESATRNVRYCDIVTPINLACPISLENFRDNDMVTVIRFCGHIFNTEQLNTWFTSNCRCPVCRYDIRNYNSNNSLGNRENLSRPVENNIEPVVDTLRHVSNNEPLMSADSAFSSYLYRFMNDNQDVSGNNNISDTEAILNLITSIQRSI